MSEYTPEFMALLDSVKAKRPQTVIRHILEYGYVTSQQLKDMYGYNHPPRAVRDVREYGIPIVTERIVGADGRKVAAYKFGNPDHLNQVVSKTTGRSVLSKNIKQELIRKNGSRCNIYMEYMDESVLQIDHRIPYEICGEQPNTNVDDYMLLSPSANRMKSWTCENCENWIKHDILFCSICFWAYPENYQHVAGKLEKVIYVLFTGNEINDYTKLMSLYDETTPNDVIKRVIREKIQNTYGINDRHN